MSEKNLLDNIHLWIIESKTTIIRWLIGITITGIGTLATIMYSDHQTLAANDVIVKEYKKKLDNIVILPVIQQEQIKDMKEGIKDLRENQKYEFKEIKEEQSKMKSRQDDIYTIVLKMSQKK